MSAWSAPPRGGAKGSTGSRSSAVVSCFLLSAHENEQTVSKLLAEEAANGDLLLLDAPETSLLLRRPTRYSNFTRRGRGVQQSRGGVHYAIHRPEPHILLFRRPQGTDPTTGLVHGKRIDPATGKVVG